MLFGKIVSFVRTVAFRLTLWYGAIFSACGVALFIICYLLVASSLRWQIDRSLHESFLQIQTAWQNGGLEAAQADMLRETSAEGAKGIYFRIAGPDGRTLASTDEKNWREVADHARLYWRQDPPGRVVETISVGKGGKEARLFEDSLEEGVVLQVAKSLRYDQQQLERLQRIFAALLALFVATAIALGWVMARRALSGVEQIRNTAERIAKGALDSRVPVRGIGDEIDQLALTFNTMLARIQKVVSEMREMGDNIAHDLKSPIARIRANNEMILRREKEGENAAAAGDAIEECDRLLGVINTMLEISEAESGVDVPSSAEVDIVPIARTISEMYQPSADDKGVRLSLQTPPVCSVIGDRRRLYRALMNLVDNALKYTPDGGNVQISVNCENGTARISVEDSGAGIAPEDLPKIFERFYRGDASRTHEGNGLGLSLARALIRAHKGEIHAQSAPGRGSVFTVVLPLVRAAAEAPAEITKM